MRSARTPVEPPPKDTPRLELHGLRKYFASSGVLAVADVSLEVWPGEIVAIIGENGTGKSTLMNLLFGVHEPDAGEIVVDGSVRTITSPLDAIAAGLGMVHQHFELVPSFSVAQNVLLGREPVRHGLYDDRAARALVADLAARSGLTIDVASRVGDLPVGAQQRVEILKALAAEARTLIFDEPTAVLTPPEAEDLLHMIRGLARTGRSILFISHKLPEVQAIADRIIVMRKGEIVKTLRRGEADDAELSRLMVGRDVHQPRLSSTAAPGPTVLDLDEVRVPGHGGVGASTFGLRRGEVLGIAGVSGNGQDELVEAIAGLSPVDGGTVRLHGRDITGAAPAAIRRAGIAHIAADRMAVGLNLHATLEENAVATSFRAPRFARRGVIRRGERRAFATRLIEEYEVRGSSPSRTIRTLSGGNLQKIVIGRELAADPAVVLANQPTRGLDVGSIEFVHRALLTACEGGAGILLVSTELEEVLALSHRIAVMYQGRLIGPFDHDRIDREEIGRLMAAGEEAA